MKIVKKIPISCILIMLLFILGSVHFNVFKENNSNLALERSNLADQTSETKIFNSYLVKEETSYTFLNFTDFLDQYNASIETGKPHIIEAYLEWQETFGGGFPAIQNDTYVVFIYYNPNITIDSISLQFMTFYPTKSYPMTQLDNEVNFFFMGLSFEPTARVDYWFIINGTEQLDPRNPNLIAFSFTDRASELAMPNFIQPSEIIYRSDIPHGNLTNLPYNGSNPVIQVYIPPDYNPNGSYPTVYAADGSYYSILGNMTNVLDNLIADQRIQPLIVVFIDPIDFDPLNPELYNWNIRRAWYDCNPEYLTYLDGLVKYIDDHYATNRSAYARLHLGLSMSGLTSAYVALERPDVFKLVGSHGGAFFRIIPGESYNILARYENASVSLDLKLWLSAGSYEMMLECYTRELEQICRSKGWLTEAIYFHDGHSIGAWRHTLDDLLEFFFPYPISPSTTTFPSTTGSRENNTVSSTETADSSPDFELFVVFSGLLAILIIRGKKSKKNER